MAVDIDYTAVGWLAGVGLAYQKFRMDDIDRNQWQVEDFITVLVTTWLLMWVVQG
jgi:hypothetical protein